MTLDGLAERSGEAPERLQRYVALGILNADAPAEKDVERVRLVAASRTAAWYW